MRKGHVLFLFSHSRQKKQRGRAPSRWLVPHEPLHRQLPLCPGPLPSLCGRHHCHTPSDPPRLSAHWTYQKFQIFRAVSIFSVYMLGIQNGSWPENVQHLPHTDAGPLPVLGSSVLCWSNSDSNFKMFSAAISWQDSTSLPIPWLIRGG